MADAPAWTQGLLDLTIPPRLATLEADRAVYQGTWDPNTNTPVLADGTGTQGDFFRAEVAASRNLGSGVIAFAVGDYVLYDADPGVWTRVAGPADTMPWSIEIDPFTAPATQTTWNTIIVNAAVVKAGYLQAAAQNSQLGWDVNLAAGTWTLSLLCLTTAASAIVTVALDGVTVGAIDLYSAGTVVNVVKNLTGVAVASSGRKRLTLTLATRNAANTTGFNAQLQHASLRRTA